MPTRLNQPVKVATNWDRLMKLALLRAQEANDPRTKILQAACNKGQSQSILKRYGIIGEADLDREFPREAK